MRVNRGPVLKALPAVLTAVLLLLAGCSNGSPDAAAARAWTAPRTMPAGMGSGAADGVFPRTVKHFSGSTPLKAAPKRVVVISTGQADALLTLGVVPVGTTRGDGAELVPRYLLAAFPAAAKIADVGSRVAPDLETIGNLKPDLVVMNTAGKDAAALHASLSAIAPTVATQGTGLYWKQDFLLLADALGKTQQAQHLLDTYHADAAALGASLHPAPSVSFLRKNADRLRIFGVPSFTGSIAEDAGLARPQAQQFGQTSQDISDEELDRADGDWIFYGVQGGPAKAAALTSAPLWPTLTAVAAKTAIPVDDDVFYLNTGPTAAREVLEALQQALRR